jgi:hypothetical protein
VGCGFAGFLFSASFVSSEFVESSIGFDGAVVALTQPIPPHMLSIVIARVAFAGEENYCLNGISSGTGKERIVYTCRKLFHWLEERLLILLDVSCEIEP